jgi:hypothetical protein
MWTRLELKHWWVRAFGAAVAFAFFYAVDWGARLLAHDSYESWRWTLVIDGGFTVVFGVLVAVFTGTSHQVYNSILEGLDRTQRSAAVDASFRGPVPADVSVRDAAIRVTRRRLSSARFWRWMWLFLLALSVGSYLIGWFVWKRGLSTWELDDWVNFAISVGFVVVAWQVSLRAKHRLELLTQAAH